MYCRLGRPSSSEVTSQISYSQVAPAGEHSRGKVVQDKAGVPRTNPGYLEPNPRVQVTSRACEFVFKNVYACMCKKYALMCPLVTMQNIVPPKVVDDLDQQLPRGTSVCVTLCYNK